MYVGSLQKQAAEKILSKGIDTSLVNIINVYGTYLMRTAGLTDQHRLFDIAERSHACEPGPDGKRNDSFTLLKEGMVFFILHEYLLLYRPRATQVQELFGPPVVRPEIDRFFRKSLGRIEITLCVLSRCHSPCRTVKELMVVCSNKMPEVYLFRHHEWIDLLQSSDTETMLYAYSPHLLLYLRFPYSLCAQRRGPPQPPREPAQVPPQHRGAARRMGDACPDIALHHPLHIRRHEAKSVRGGLVFLAHV